MKTCILILAAAASSAVLAEMPLPEHPRPDWERSEWTNLNGTWRFAFDKSDSGVKDRWFAAPDSAFPMSITVPFPWGSPLSGVADEADVAWYRRDVTVPAAWKGKRVFVVVGASDHDTGAWLDGVRIGGHSGGYTPFEFEITDLVKWGMAQKLTLRVWDLPAEAARSRDRKSGDWRLFGKQGYGNARGVWQTVYLEARGREFLDHVHFTPDIENGSVTADVALGAPAKVPLSFEVRFKESDRAKPAAASFAPGQMSAKVKIPLRNVKRWDLDSPYLYEVTCALAPEKPSKEFPPDAVKTYFGMRKIGVGKIPGTEHPCVTLNNKPIYLQLTLDQSYHPYGFYTFPTDEFMKNEILISKRLALTGNRVHIKVEVPRKLYWADKLGLLIMADVPNAWGPASEAMFREHALCMEDMICRDFNHPSIFSWVLFNETWGLFDFTEAKGGVKKTYRPWAQREVAKAYARAKRLDPTRLVEDNSPCRCDHVVTDINTWHCYLPGYKWEDEVVKRCRDTAPGSGKNYIAGFSQRSEPMFNSECGNVWGYKGSTGDCDWSWDYHWMMNAFRRNLQCCGWLYTEHHDVINEWNGYVRADRTPKCTGIEELTGGRISLRDLHADAYLPLDRELCREFKAGETWKMPVDVSLTTDRYAGRKFALAGRIAYWNASGRLREVALDKTAPFTLSAWQNGRLADVPVALPKETACGVVCFSLVEDGKDGDDGDETIARNFACFVTRGAANANVASVAPAAFTKSEWSVKRWDVLDGLKVCGAGKGFFEYGFDLAPGAKKAVFRAEVSSKRLNAKDATGLNDNGGTDIDCMLGGGHSDRSRNPNSYPMTSCDKWPGAVKVYVNGELVKTVEMPDDPADHRGVLSWFSQPRDRTLHEAGSYGYLVEAEIPETILAKGGGRVNVRLEADKGGLAIYGARFGRFPFDPHVEFVRRSDGQ